MKKIIIRRPCHNEYETWSKIYQVYLNIYQTSLTKDELQKVWSWLFKQNPELNCYFAKVDEKIVGLTHFRKFTRPIKACCGIFLDDLIVLPEFHGQGIGYQLIEAVKSYAKENNVALVRWITAHDNLQAMRLYDSVGDKTTWVTYDAKV